MITLLAAILAPLVWPLIGLLIALLILKQVKDDVRPIFIAMVGPLAKQAQTNATAWVVGMMLAVLSSMGALAEVALQMGWIYVSIACKVLGPGLATIVALVKQSPIPPQPTAPTQTAAPFQTPAQKP